MCGTFAIGKPNSSEYRRRSSVSRSKRMSRIVGRNTPLCNTHRSRGVMVIRSQYSSNVTETASWKLGRSRLRSKFLRMKK
ncbi:hypothetical protein D3C83_146910 [compost metagenome]